MPTAYYRNKRTKRRLTIIGRGAKGIQVQYAISGNKYWYTEREFEELFERITK